MKDELVPPEHTTELMAHATNARFTSLYECPDGDHNYTWDADTKGYIKAL